MYDILQPHRPYSPWNSPGQNTRVGSLSLLQEIFPTQGLNPGLSHYMQILYHCTTWEAQVSIESERCSVVSHSLRLHGLYSPWNSSGQNTGGGSLSLLQGIFPIQESTQGLLHCRRFLYQLCYHRSPAIEQASKLDYIRRILGGSDHKEST